MSDVVEPPADALADAKSALSRGDLFVAYDAATKAINGGDESEDLRQTQLLALARMGDTARALTLFRSYGLNKSQDPHKRALGARLLKDRALETRSEKALKDAYQAYREIFAKSEDPYPGINAASMALFAGDEEEARWLATNILVHPTIEEPTNYYNAATRAEAQFILRQPDEAAESIRLALTLPGGDAGAKAGTLRQLAQIAETVGIDAGHRDPILALLRAPAAFHYCGHIFAPGAAVEARIKHEINHSLGEERGGYAYGSAAAGADILVIETILERGGDVHIVLPCRKDDFVAASVRPAGEAWVPRFEACLKKATEIVFATDMEFVRDPTLFGYGAAIAMGLAKLRAQHLATDSFQLAIWDGKEGGPVGTAADVALWQKRGGDTVVVDPGAINRDYPRPEEGAPPALPRKLASILFTDYAGFSKLGESYLPAFDREVMGRIAAVLKLHEEKLFARNTWGDALYTVMDGAVGGAEIAIGLQRALAEVKPADLGLAEGQGGMRIAMHYGSVYHTTDQITGLPNFQGNEVARAARIEPITPPGAVYVTEPMAAMLALEAPDRFRCSYVGRVDLAKKYGTFPMYRLTGTDEQPITEDEEDESDSAGESMVDAKSPRLFVSHHSSKLPVAEHVEKALNAKGVKCWVAPRDIDPGEQWDVAIRKAIADTDAMLLLFCSRSEKSRQVKRELILADQLGKAIIPLRLERIDPGELSYHLADSQWIDWLEQRDVVIDRIAGKARDFQEHGPMEVAPPINIPASAADLLAPPPAPAPAAPIDFAKPAAPAPAAPIGFEKPVPPQPFAPIGLDKGPPTGTNGAGYAPPPLSLDRPGSGAPPMDQPPPGSWPPPPGYPPPGSAQPGQGGGNGAKLALIIGGSVLGAIILIVLAVVIVRGVMQGAQQGEQGQQGQQSGQQTSGQRASVQPSFDCNASNNSAAMQMVCNSDELAQMDQQVAASYRAARASLPDPTELDSNHRDWANRVNRCTDIPCLQSEYRERIDAFRQAGF